MRSIRRLSLFNGRLQQQRPKLPAGALRIAIVTQDMKGLTARFASVRLFATYDETSDTWTFVEAAGIENISDKIERHRSEGEAALGKGCRQLPTRFCLAIGGPSAVTFAIGRTR
ncbi:hypothetical protein HFN78_33975 [Rhizobium laguerreae]|uniref:hypothetical protein n=1 Tax=Rhizobium laguerreae TaxID=1076926 RepID=UPI001C907F1C|nr:hypothetical protein [Rhizobium laguerreae]MBY3475847.1 hypothetical protein [Rhizobium laguerreae]